MVVQVWVIPVRQAKTVVVKIVNMVFVVFLLLTHVSQAMNVVLAPVRTIFAVWILTIHVMITMIVVTKIVMFRRVDNRVFVVVVTDLLATNPTNAVPTFVKRVSVNDSTFFQRFQIGG